jgi:hypothetical protein
MHRELIAVDFNGVGEQAAAGTAAKQLIVLAADALLDEVSLDGRDPESVAQRLVDEGVLPACCRRRYDRRFLESFHNVIELTRNLLVSDLPFAPCTASELAAHAILGSARELLEEHERGSGELVTGASNGPRRLPDLMVGERRVLRDGLDGLEAVVIEDADALYLFQVPANQEPEEHVRLPGATSDVTLLAFENWLRPFGNPPRPQITYDGRAWPE